MSSHSVILILKKHLITLTIAHPQKISSENRQSLLKTRPQQVTALCSLIFSSLSTSSFFEYSINNNVVLTFNILKVNMENAILYISASLGLVSSLYRRSSQGIQKKKTVRFIPVNLRIIVKRERKVPGRNTTGKKRRFYMDLKLSTEVVQSASSTTFVFLVTVSQREEIQRWVTIITRRAPFSTYLLCPYLLHL